MPQKQPFDHRRHLLDQSIARTIPDGGEETKHDEALARILQEEILEEERRLGRGGSAPGSGNGVGMNILNMPAANQYAVNPTLPDTTGDMQLLLALQREEMEALRDNQHIDDLELARRMQHEEALGQMQSDYRDQVSYARRLQERVFRQRLAEANVVPIVATAGFPVSYDSSRSSSANRAGNSRRSEHESDLDLARRMQELEQMGMGRLNSGRNISTSVETDAMPKSAVSQQEEEDAILARMLADSGQSLRDLMPQASTTSPTAVAPPVEAPFPVRTAVNDVRRASEFDPPFASHLVSQPPVRNIAIPVARDKTRDLTDTSRNSRSPKNNRTGRASTSPMRNQPDIADHPFMVNIATENLSPKATRKKFGGLFRKTSNDTAKKGDKTIAIPSAIPQKPTSVPTPIPSRPLTATVSPLPYSSVGTHLMDMPVADAASARNKLLAAARKRETLCSNCQKPATTFLVALDKKYHPECFKCVGCNLIIDQNAQFAFTCDDRSNKHPLHRQCYAELYGVKCSVCRKSIPVGPDGKVSFVKHPFFDKEQMCPHHAKSPGRRCTGCHRFEPEGEPFAELSDNGRCVCFSCCRSVVVDSVDAQPLWDSVIYFFENFLNLPIWSEMRKVPILVVGYEALNAQMLASGAAHGGSSQIMTRGLCLTEHQSGHKFKLAKLKYDKDNSSFVSGDVEARGYTYFQVPDANKANPDASVTAILCLSGLPRDLAASVLAHEATHAWIKMHPRFDLGYPIPPQVEEGCAQLVAMLYLTEGMAPASTETYGDSGPSDEKLRQYFKFSIETDDNEVYGEGYRKAAAAYADIGIEALLSHIVLYQEFPKT